MAVCWHCFTNSYNSKRHRPSEPGFDENPFLLLPASVATPAEELLISTEFLYQLLLLRAVFRRRKSAIFSPENMPEEQV